MMKLSLSLATGLNLMAGGMEFEPNRGQTGREVQFLARTPGGLVFFTDSEIVFDRGLRLGLVGAKTPAKWEAEGSRIGSISYRTGRDEGKWVSDVPSYGRIVRRGLYPGIDAVFYGAAGELEKAY